MTIKSFEALTREEIVQLARAQAEAGECCSHGFAPLSLNAARWEQAYEHRSTELQPHG